MLKSDVKVVDINLEHWKHMAAQVDKINRARRLFVIHEGGKVVKCYDSAKGDQDLPVKNVEDAQALAEKLAAADPELYEVHVVDPEAYAAHQGQLEAGWKPGTDPDEVVKAAWAERKKSDGLGIAPERGFLWMGLPMERYTKFINKMLPDRCVYVMAAFEGEEIWASLIVGFDEKKIDLVTTFDALDKEDLKDVKGRDQHPFLLSMVTNQFHRPAFGWFCDKQVLEDYLSAGDEQLMDEVFQKALMEKKSTFDFNVLIENGITPLGAINPAEGVDGQRQG